MYLWSQTIIFVLFFIWNKTFRFWRSVTFGGRWLRLILLTLSMSVGWDVKWCPVSRITTPLARKRPFHWISMKSRFVRAARETLKLLKWSPFNNSRRRYMAEILPIRRKSLYNHSINKLNLSAWFAGIVVGGIPNIFDTFRMEFPCSILPFSLR